MADRFLPCRKDPQYSQDYWKYIRSKPHLYQRARELRRKATFIWRVRRKMGSQRVVTSHLRIILSRGVIKELRKQTREGRLFFSPLHRFIPVFDRGFDWWGMSDDSFCHFELRAWEVSFPPGSPYGYRFYIRRGRGKEDDLFTIDRVFIDRKTEKFEPRPVTAEINGKTVILKGVIEIPPLYAPIFDLGDLFYLDEISSAFDELKKFALLVI